MVLRDVDPWVRLRRGGPVARTWWVLFVPLVLLLVFTGAAFWQVVIEEQGISWKSLLGTTVLWLLFIVAAATFWTARAHATTVFAEEGVLFTRAFARSAFVPWNEFRRITKIPLLQMWLFSTETKRFWLDMSPFQVRLVERIILEHVSDDCGLVGRFCNRSFWDWIE